MKQTPAQRMAQQAATPAPTPAPTEEPGKGGKEKGKNTAPFTIWAPPESVKKWRAYLTAKKVSGITQNEIIQAAIEDYIQAHPVTDEEKRELLKTLEI